MNFMFQKETEKIQKMLEEQDYVADPSILMSVYLAKTLHKPLLIEGPAGVGKTEIAKVMARALETDLIRLQCCLLYTSPSPRDGLLSRMPSSA